MCVEARSSDFVQGMQERESARVTGPDPILVRAGARWCVCVCFAAASVFAARPSAAAREKERRMKGREEEDAGMVTEGEDESADSPNDPVRVSALSLSLQVGYGCCCCCMRALPVERQTGSRIFFFEDGELGIDFKNTPVHFED